MIVQLHRLVVYTALVLGAGLDAAQVHPGVVTGVLAQEAQQRVPGRGVVVQPHREPCTHTVTTFSTLIRQIPTGVKFLQTCNINAYSLQKRIFFDFSRFDSPVPLLGVWLVVGEGHHLLAGAAAVGREGAGGGGGAQAGRGRVLARVPAIQ